MSQTRSSLPNPKRVIAGRRNRAKRGPLTAEGRARLRLAIQRVQPWRYATGPKTDAGKARAAQNGKLRQVGPRSVREVRLDLADLPELLQGMWDACRLAAGPPPD